MNSEQLTVGERASRTGTGCVIHIPARGGLVFTVFCLLFTLLLGGCGGGGIRHKIERGIAKGMEQKLGPAKSYSVKITGPTMALVSGKLRGIEITGLDVKTPQGIVVQRLRVNVQDLEVDVGTEEIKKCGGTTYSATLSQAELARYLTKMYPDAPDFRLEFLDGFARVTAKPGVSIAKVSVVVDASVDILQHRRLALNLKELDVAGLPTPGFVRDYVERKVNPVFNVDDLDIGATIDSVSMRRGSVTVAGTLDLEKASGSKKRNARQPESWER